MQHLSLKPAFVLGASFAVLLLIPLWAGFGVFGGGEEGGHAEGGHGGGGHGAIEEFTQETRAFVARNTRQDGCVAPLGAQPDEKKEHEGGEGHQPGAGHEREGQHADGQEREGDEHEEGEHGEEHAGEQGRAGEAEREAGGHQEQRGHDEGNAVSVVYLQAFQWGYNPSALCLEAGRTYEFRMMATDVTHGASVQLGPASKMVRLPPGQQVEERITFTRPGEYLLYCSYYCGVGHQAMKGRVVVEGHHEDGPEERGTAKEEHGEEGHHEEEEHR